MDKNMIDFLSDLKTLITEDDEENENTQNIMMGKLNSLDRVDKEFTLGKIDKLQGRRIAINQIKNLMEKHNIQ